MRRLHKYCLKRIQPKLSWNPRNCYNLSRFQPLNERNLNIFQIEWKSKTLCRLFFNGDVTNTTFKRTYEQFNRDMLQTLGQMEHRVDNVVFRSMFASSVFAARKLVSEGKVLVNGRRVTFPDQRLKVGDVLQIDPKHADKVRSLADHPFIRLWSFIPSYLEVSFSSLSSSLIRAPSFVEIPHPFPRRMVNSFAAFYSKR